MSRTTVRVIPLLVLAMLVLSACGQPLLRRQAASPSPTSTPPRGGGNIASGAASDPSIPGLAPAARPPSGVAFAAAIATVSANGTCPDSHAIKIGHDLLAYPPTNTRYPTVQPTACYATLADAAADGHRPAPGTPSGTP